MTTPHSQHYNPDSGYDPWTVQDKWWHDYPGDPASLMYLAPALKYLCRLGRKEGESIVKDLDKCIAYLSKVRQIENTAELCRNYDAEKSAEYKAAVLSRKVNEKEAPLGYLAKPATAFCDGCAFYVGSMCRLPASSALPCSAESRLDGQDVILVRDPSYAFLDNCKA